MKKKQDKSCDILVSIIVTIYNKKDVLRRCVESILRQTYRNIEIILVDDGSVDGTSELCDKIAMIDSRIIVLHKENGGQVSARKAGVNTSNGKYIQFVDADDWIEDNMTQKMLEKALNNESDFVTCGMNVVSENGSKPIIDLIEEGLYYKNEERKKLASLAFYDKEGNSCIIDSMNNRLIEKVLIEKCLMSFPETVVYAEDTFVVFVAFMLARRITIMHECFYYYMTQESTISKSKNEFIIRDLNEGYVYALKKIPNGELFKIYKRQLERIFLNYLFLGIDRNMEFNEEHQIIRHFFPREVISLDAKISIYGAGVVGQSFYNQLIKDYDIVYWIDNNANNINTKKRQVIVPDKVDVGQTDYIIIAIKDEQRAQGIIEELEKDFGWQREKLIWRKPISLLDIIVNEY